MKAFEDELDKRRDLEEVSVGDEYAFWKEKQEALQVGSENYNKIEKTLGGLHQQMFRSMREYYNRLPAAMAEVAHKAEEEQRKLDEAMKKAHENAADSLSLKREDAKGKYQELSEASQIRVETGQESNGQRIKDLKKALDEEHQLETDSYKDQADLYAVGTDEYTDVLKKKHKADFEYFKEYTALQKQAMEQGPTGAINDLIRRGTDYAAQSKELIDSTFNTLNDSLLKMMTSQYHKGDWKNAGKSVFTGVAKTGLQDAEGSLMKAFGIGGIGSASGAASVADSASQSGGFFNGFFEGIGSFFGGMETGGLMKPGGFYLTGERGPELLRVGSTTRINNARDTSRIMSSGGGSHVEHHYHIDARGATDPAAVTAAINRAISRAAPQIAASSIAAFQDMKARRPSIYG
jgi:lambda family phage tail tape measure protein